jgi:S-(hydroxymethyl)glutathione dehydrogenase/alcohol dehydrogenase
MKVRAAVLEEFGAPLQVQQLDLAKPKTAEVLVRLARPSAAAASRF